MIEIEWDVFHTKYLNQNTVFIEETLTDYILYTYEGIIILKSIVSKKEDSEENIMFVERYFSGRTNIVRALSVDYGSKEIVKEEENIGGMSYEEVEGAVESKQDVEDMTKVEKLVETENESEGEIIEAKQDDEEPEESEAGDKPWQRKPWKEKPWTKPPVIPAKER